MDDDAAARVYTTLLPLPDGRVLPVGDWVSSDLAAVRRRVAGRARLRRLHAARAAAGSQTTAS